MIVPTSFLPSVLNLLTDLLGDLAPLIFLIVGILLAFYLFERLIGWIENLAEIKREKVIALETGIARILKTLRIKPTRLEEIKVKAKKEPAVRKAIELHAKFKELMAQD